MKKLFGLLLATLMAIPSSAAIISNVEVKGEVQTIASDVKNVDMSDIGINWYYSYDRGVKTRAIAGLSFDIFNTVKANILFQYAYRWGDRNYLNNGFNDAHGVQLANANLVFSNIFDALEITIGRQFYGEEDSPVIYFGPKHYNSELTGYDRNEWPGYGRTLGYASTLDAAKFVYNNDWMEATLLGGVISHPDEFSWSFREKTTGARDNVPLFGADIKFHLTQDFTARVFGYDWEDSSYYTFNPGKWRHDKHTGLYGVKFSYAPEHFLVSAEYARNTGSKTGNLFREHHQTGQMVKADLAVSPADAFTLRGTFYYAQFYYINLGGYSPSLLMGNMLQDRLTRYGKGVRMFNVGTDFRPADQWTISLDGYSFQSASANHQAALEADLTAKYDYNEYIQLFAGIGYIRYSKHQDTYAQSYFANLKDRDNVKSQIGMLVRF